MKRAGAASPPPWTTKPRPPLKTTPVGPPGTAIVIACLRPSPAYRVLELRASFATHHGPPALAARPHGLTSCPSAPSVTSGRTTNRSLRALLAGAAAASAATTTAAAAVRISAGGDRRRLQCR